MIYRKNKSPLSKGVFSHEPVYWQVDVCMSETEGRLRRMKVGLIGSGNMARALARGWGDPVLCTDSGSGRAQALVDELGGERVASNRELAERVDLVVLCHKPYHLQQ